MPESAKVSKENGRGSGASSPEPLASYDPATSSWRTYQLSLLGGSVEFSETWPRAGTMRSGIAYPQQPLAPLTAVTGSSLWHTPSVEDAARKGSAEGWRQWIEEGRTTQARLRNQVHWPTPRSCSAMAATFTPEAIKKAPERFPNLESVVAQTDPVAGGALNPTWVEWLQGFPLGWTDCEDSGTP
jgi:hypothetical protein